MKNYFPKKNNGIKNFLKNRGSLLTLVVCMVAVASVGYLSLRNGSNDTPGDVWDETAGSNRDVIFGSILESNPGQWAVKDNKDDAVSNADKSDAAADAMKDSGKETDTDVAVNATPEQIKYSLPVSSGEILVPFSIDTPVFSKTMNDYRAHMGVDISAKSGDDVLASAKGTVENAYYDELRGYTIEIRHTDGVLTLYSGLTDLSLAPVGSKVKAGEVIGKLGKVPEFESADGEHLHFEMLKDGVYLNPQEYLNK